MLESLLLAVPHAKVMPKMPFGLMQIFGQINAGLPVQPAGSRLVLPIWALWGSSWLHLGVQAADSLGAGLLAGALQPSTEALLGRHRAWGGVIDGRRALVQLMHLLMHLLFALALLLGVLALLLCVLVLLCGRAPDPLDAFSPDGALSCMKMWGLYSQYTSATCKIVSMPAD